MVRDRDTGSAGVKLILNKAVRAGFIEMTLEKKYMR